MKLVSLLYEWKYLKKLLWQCGNVSLSC